MWCGGHQHGLGELVHQDLDVVSCKTQGQNTEEVHGHRSAPWVTHMKQRGLPAMSSPANGHYCVNVRTWPLDTAQPELEWHNMGWGGHSCLPALLTTKITWPNSWKGHLFLPPAQGRMGLSLGQSSLALTTLQPSLCWEDMESNLSAF